MRSLIRLFACVSIGALWLPAAFAQEAISVDGFTDVPITHPQYTAITELKQQGIINGYEDGSFKPERTVTRAELLKIVLLAMRVEPVPQASVSFSDVPESAWFVPYIATATQLGIVGGYPDGSFQPSATVSRVEGLKILLKAKGVVLPEPHEQLFIDVPLGEWYTPYVQYVVDHDLLEVPGEEFGRDEGLRRQDIAQMLYHIDTEERAATLPVIPLVAALLAALLWLAAGTTHFLYQRTTQTPLTHILFMALGPIGVLWHCLRSISFARSGAHQSAHDILTFTSRVMDFARHPGEAFAQRRHTYFRRPRYLTKEVLGWIDSNRAPLFGVLYAGVTIYLCAIITLTSMTTYEYKSSFAPTPSITTPAS